MTISHDKWWSPQMGELPGFFDEEAFAGATFVTVFRTAEQMRPGELAGLDADDRLGMAFAAGAAWQREAHKRKS